MNQYTNVELRYRGITCKPDKKQLKRHCKPKLQQGIIFIFPKNPLVLFLSFNKFIDRRKCVLSWVKKISLPKNGATSAYNTTQSKTQRYICPMWTIITMHPNKRKRIFLPFFVLFVLVVVFFRWVSKS